MSSPPRSTRRRWSPLLFFVLLLLGADRASKHWAVENLELYQPERVLGSWLPVTLVYNRFAAFGVGIGEHSRWIFSAAALCIVLWLLWSFARTSAPARMRGAATALVVAGALGNLIDRLRSEMGVVDFIGPFRVGEIGWPVFNLADVWVSLGALLLVAALWREDVARERERGAKGGSTAA